MKEQKQVFIISSEFPPQPGGIGNHAYNLAKHLQNHGKTVTVLTDNRSVSGSDEIQFDANCAFKVVRVPVTKPRIFMYLLRFWKALQLIKKHNILIVSGKFPIWLGAILSLVSSLKKIAIVHGTEVNFKKNLLKKSIDFALNRYQKIIAVSNHTKNLLTPNNQLKCVVIPNGFDPDKFDSTREQEIDLEGNPALITVGNVTERKGQLNVIKQLPHLRKVFPELHYHIVGLPTQKEEFLKEAAALKVAQHITFHGVVPDVLLKTYLLKSTIFVMLSSETATGDVEGFGIAVLEANYLGIPAIGATNCGIEDAVLEGKSGHLINYNDSEAFVNAITSILKSKEVYKKEAIKWGNKHCWENVIQEYLKNLEF